MKNAQISIFSQSDLKFLKSIQIGDVVSSVHTLDNCGIVLGQENGLLSVLSPFEDTIMIQDRHPFFDKINHMIRTSRSGETELAIVTAGQVYFTNIDMQPTSVDDQGIEKPKCIRFELDELYVDDGAQITRVEEYEPNKFIALTWWTNKIYLFQRDIIFNANGKSDDMASSINRSNTIVVQASFGINL